MLIPPTDHTYAGAALGVGLASAAFSASMLLTSYWLRQRDGTPEARHCTLHVATMLSVAYFLHAAVIIAAGVFQLAVQVQGSDSGAHRDDEAMACTLTGLGCSIFQWSILGWSSAFAWAIQELLLQNLQPRDVYARRWRWHVLGWGVPVLLSTPLLAATALKGDATTLPSSLPWCLGNSAGLLDAAFGGGKLWELIIMVPVLASITQVSVTLVLIVLRFRRTLKVAERTTPLLPENYVASLRRESEDPPVRWTHPSTWTVAMLRKQSSSEMRERAQFLAVERRLGTYLVVYYLGLAIVLAHSIQVLRGSVIPPFEEPSMPRALYQSDAFSVSVLSCVTVVAFYANPRNRLLFTATDRVTTDAAAMPRSRSAGDWATYTQSSPAR
jgi:hypothetical protein